MSELKRLSMIFRLKYDRLTSILEDDNTDDVLEISAILRHLLIGDSLADSVGTLFGLPISFPLTDTPAPPIYGKTSDFLKAPVLGYKIEDIIDAFANYAGGVHHQPKNPIQIAIVENLLGCFEKDDAYQSLREISRKVIQGLTPIRDAINRNVRAFEQRKRSRQPMALEKAVWFNGSHYLEGWCHVSFDRGFSVVVTYCIPEKFIAPECIFSLGNRREKTEISFSRSEAKLLEASVRFKGRFVCRLQAKGNRFSKSGVACITLRPQDGSTKSFSLDFANDFNRSVSTDGLNGEVEGKMVFGADLNGKMCARVQTSDLAFLFDSPISPEDMSKLFENCKMFLPEWVHANPHLDPAYVVRIYNQGSAQPMV